MLDSLDFSFISETTCGTAVWQHEESVSFITTRGIYLGGWIHGNADDAQLDFRH